ncbi:RDD family protein [Undibacterium oligocarboniphilum]|uniref:RDD family protein n=1 Tax=Undibacterium oligocarboniphilum TaxID=666702 RepID=A0A850QHU8_9BURK|nr:RDD family protein [Undibacterium oligocarboniphilum]MBC3869045.1 RDD family protein [Undibacterium oligocarboniphilum]NVO77025.1 RDD family protein [Undibacterium oligocarboniphilum]
MTGLQVPLLRRRLICMVYEAMLLFGIVFVSGFIFDVITQSRHALMLRHLRQFWLFLVIGAYFVFCWSRSGQTLAMQTWRIRVTDLDGSRVPVIKAVVRYCLSWMWFLPAMALDYQFGLKEWHMVIVVALGIAGWALTARMDKDGQFLHDRLAKTRLIDVPAETRLTTQA